MSRMYSLAQKHCVKISIEKSMVIFSVNLLENLHASTYDIYNCIYRYKIKKMPRMATLNYKHSANFGRSYNRAHYTIVHKGRKDDARISSLVDCMTSI